MGWNLRPFTAEVLIGAAGTFDRGPSVGAGDAPPLGHADLGTQIRASGQLVPDKPQRSLVGSVLAGAQGLDPGRVIAIEWRDGVGAVGLGCILRRVEPETEMERMHRIGRGVAIRVWKRSLVMNDRRPGGAGRDDEGLDAEPADERADPDTVLVGLNVALIPGQAEGRIGDLDHEKVEFGIRWQLLGDHRHLLDRSERMDGDAGPGPDEAVGLRGCGRAYHVERDRVRGRGWGYRRPSHETSHGRDEYRPQALPPPAGCEGVNHHIVSQRMHALFLPFACQPALVPAGH